MKIIDLLKNEKVCISCELFPPKAGTELQNALNIVSDIGRCGAAFYERDVRGRWYICGSDGGYCPGQ